MRTDLSRPLPIEWVSIAASMLLLRHDVILNSLYNHSFPVGEVVRGLLMLVALFAVVAFVANAVLVRLRAVRVTTFLAVAAAVGAAAAKLIPALAYGQRVSIPVSLFLAGLIGAVLAARFWSDETRARYARAATTAALIYALMMPLWGLAYRAPVQEVFPAATATDTSSERNVVILLLDELGAGAAGGVVQALQVPGMHVSVREIKAAGVNTINVIPRMLTGGDYSSVLVCGPTLLCNMRGRSLDFSRLVVGRSDVDVAGMFHPYCEMHGLRWCVQGDRRADSFMSEFTCWYPLVRSIARMVGACHGDHWLSASRIRHEANLFSAPFWNRGGVLFAHIMLPHLPASGEPHDLAADYGANLAEASRLVARVRERLAATFGSEYVLVVSSDHPLRVDLWCNTLYAGKHCEVPPQYLVSAVPLIVASPHNADVPLISTNADLFRFAR